MPERTIGIALLGGGVVGSGVVKILTEQRDLLRRRTGIHFDVRHVVVRDLAKPRDFPAGLRVSTDANAAIDDPTVDIIVEVVGGTTHAAHYVERALKSGKPVVTANKSLLAARGTELFSLAKKHNTCVAFEASCGGGIPIIASLQHGLIANRIDALVGIVNGTCNFILTKMTQNGWSYADALKAAQDAGFAEADPTMDVSGRDTAQKLAVLASLAFNARVSEADIHIEGIDTLQADDIAYAKELGYVIKLLAIAERKSAHGAAGSGQGGGSDRKNSFDTGAPSSAGHQTILGDAISLRVHPTLVHSTDVLADVSGSFNAISVFGHALGHALFYGRGAGSLPTASAIVSDIVNVGLGVTPLAFKQLAILPDATSPARVLPFNELLSRYYLRLMARDEPGVLAQVTKILGDNKISLRAILQHEVNDSQLVPVIITTHLAREGAIQTSLKEINALPTIQAPTACLRIIDQPKEFAAG